MSLQVSTIDSRIHIMYYEISCIIYYKLDILHSVLCIVSYILTIYYILRAALVGLLSFLEGPILRSVMALPGFQGLAIPRH